jgi:hypothetical protein
MRRCIVALVGLLAFGISGCAPSQSELEKSIKEGMKSQLNVEVSSLNLTKQSDGSYVGTASCTNGDVYDITTTAPDKGKIEWKAKPGQAAIERRVREGMEEKLGGKVKSLTLTKSSDEGYTGVGEMTTGLKYDIKVEAVGTQLRWEAVPKIN